MEKEAVILVLAFSLFSCQYFDSNSDIFVAQCHNSTLYYSDIKHLVPTGLEKNDSIDLVHSIREKWVKEQLLLQKRSLTFRFLNKKLEVKLLAMKTL